MNAPVAVAAPSTVISTTMRRIANMGRAHRWKKPFFPLSRWSVVVTLVGDDASSAVAGGFAGGGLVSAVIGAAESESLRGASASSNGVWSTGFFGGVCGAFLSDAAPPA